MLLSLLLTIVLPQTNPAATTTTITSSVSDTNKSLAKLRRRKSRTHQTSQPRVQRSRSAAGNQSSHRARCTAPGSSLSCSAYSQLHIFAAGLRCRDPTAATRCLDPTDGIGCWELGADARGCTWVASPKGSVGLAAWGTTGSIRRSRQSMSRLVTTKQLVYFNIAKSWRSGLTEVERRESTSLNRRNRSPPFGVRGQLFLYSRS